MVGNGNHPLNESHYDEFILEEYVLGQLLPDEEQAIRQHLAVCFSCRAMAAEIETFCRRVKNELENELDGAEPSPNLSFDSISTGWHKPPHRLSFSFRLQQFGPNIPFAVMIALLIVAFMVILPGADATTMRNLAVARRYEGPPVMVAAVSEHGLVLLSLGDGRSQIVTQLDEITMPRQLQFAPDGKWVAFLQGGALHVVEVRSGGKHFRVAVEETANWVWSPNGQALAYTDGNGQLAVFDAVSQTNRVMAPVQEDVWGTPVWSSDSQQIAFAAQNGIWRVMLTSGYRVEVARNPRPNELLLAPAAWLNNDSTLLVWNVTQDGQTSALYQVEINTHRLQRVEGNSVAQGTQLIWPINAQDITLVVRQNQLWTVNLSDDEAYAMPSEMPWPQAVQWSSNGAWMAYAATGQAEGKGLFLFSPQEGTLHAIELPEGATEKSVYWAGVEHLFVLRQLTTTSSNSDMCELWLVSLTTGEPPKRILSNVALPRPYTGWRWTDVLAVQYLNQ